MFRGYDFKRYDFLLVLLIITLCILGIIAIGSATLIYSDEGTSVFVDKQITGVIIGVALMIIVSFIDYHFIAKFYIVIYFVNIGLLIAVLLFGKTVNYATRWLTIGSQTIQPSEFCKVFLVIFLAAYLEKYAKYINKIWFLLITVVLIGIPIALVLIEPDLSTSIIIILIFVTLLYVAKISYKYIIVSVSVLAPLSIVGFWYIQLPDQKLLKGYQVTRILSLVYPSQADASSLLQTNNSIQAIGSGQLLGKGLYMGKLNQYNYLPEPQTDFIFSIIGEEFGFVGCSIVLILLLLLIIKVVLIAKDAKDLTGTLIITGAVSIIAYQTFVNVGVVTGMLPNTGVTLPFISYGLSSLLTNMIAFGMVLNVSIQRKSVY